MVLVRVESLADNTKNGTSKRKCFEFIWREVQDFLVLLKELRFVAVFLIIKSFLNTGPIFNKSWRHSFVLLPSCGFHLSRLINLPLQF